MLRSLLKKGRNSKTLWLILIVVTFTVSAVFSLYQLKESITILDKRYGTSVWALFQLKSEMRRFDSELRLYAHEGVAVEDLHFRYDLLWSRFPVLLQGVDANQISNIDGALPMLQAAFSELREVEQRLMALPGSGRQQEVKVIRERLEPYLRAVEKMALDNYHFNNQFYNRGDRRVAELQQQLIILMLGLIVSGGVLFLMVVKESRFNRYQADHDSLTGLPNRVLMRRELDQLCKGPSSFSLHLLDLNGFKDVNDTLGHHAGDLLLDAVAKRLHNQLSLMGDYRVCRLGGDEFAVIQFPLRSDREAEETALAMIKTLEGAFHVDGHNCYVGASVGTVIYPEHGDEVSSLMSRADMAMYRAKQHSPESAFRLFQFEMDEVVKRRQQLQRDLREALEHNHLRLEYQPIVELTSNRIVYHEALLRWDHPLIGAVSPLEVVEVAEQYALAQALGEWVIRTACQQSREWLNLGCEIVPISVNISPAMYRCDLVETIEKELADAGLAAGSLWIEVTEDTAMQVIKEAQELLPELNRSGVSIALDDFGTGLSSLSHLRQLAVQTLKIDRSFIRDVCQTPTASALVANIIGIGHDLGMKVVAEGIEDESAASLLRHCGCDLGQGYLFSRPVAPQFIPPLYRQFGVTSVELQRGLTAIAG